MAHPPEEIPLFAYDRLPNAATHIRLLQILALDESQSAQVHAKLTVWPRATAPPYHAISYTWGDPNDTAVVLVNAKRMVVRRNCEYVLKQAKWYENGSSSRRKVDKGNGYFWCDAICIDQGNNPEKSFQVAMMGEIYKGAERVLACVGEGGEGSEMVFEEMRRRDAWLLRAVAALESAQAAKARRSYNEVLSRIGGLDLSSKATRRGMINSRLLRLCSARWAQSRQGSVWMRVSQALNRLANRQYFQRVWIYQELSLGSGILVCCGKDIAPLRMIYGMLTVVYGATKLARRLALDSFDVDESWEGLRQCEDMVEVGCVSRLDQRRLLEALYTVSVLKCVDARDRVYGVLSLVEWEPHETAVFPDYTRDNFELGVGVLEKLGAFHFRVVMKCLALGSSESEGLFKARRQRRYCHMSTTAPDELSSHAAEVPASVPNIAPFSHAFGLRILEHHMQLHFTNHSTSGIELRIHKWPHYCQRDGLPETYQERLEIVVLVPSDTEAGDWCIFHRSEACHSGWIVLIARCIQPIDDTDENLVKSGRRHPFIIRGKGLAFVHGAKDEVTGGSAVPQLERAFTNSLGARWRRWFDVYCSAEDALCLESSFAPDVRLELESLQDERLSEYLETAVCGQPGSSFAFDIWTHAGVQPNHLHGGP